ncbi:hypothetical protein HMPREF1531_00260 [Propionibacterium sp. oral taxon 192 str. F0372]|nr:hypothetical protein HMPREF1531_00260 [Propionibacterium sp. oral taxon 192 str. F0372]
MTSLIHQPHAAASRTRQFGPGPRRWSRTDPATDGCEDAFEVRPAGDRDTMEDMAKREKVLQVSDLTKKYGDHVVVDGFNLTVRAGEAIALTGRNGSGKSTVLRCLIGADRPTSGRVEVLGRKASETDPQFRTDVATIVDDLDFFPDLSVVEHLDLLARAHGMVDPDDLVDEILAEVQLVPQSGQLPGTLSSGQRRRLALATALVRPKKLLIMDEPEQRLDVEGVSWLGKRLAHEMTKGLAIVMASHEPRLVKAMGARIVRLGDESETNESLVEPEQAL